MTNSERARARYRKDPAKYIARADKWRKENYEKMCASRDARRESIRQQSRASYQRNKNEIQKGEESSVQNRIVIRRQNMIDDAIQN